MANILILGVKVPFRFGGQEVLVNSLKKEIASRGHDVDIVELPFNLPTKDACLMHAELWKAIDFTEFAGTKVDLIIATKFPSYFARHPNKSIWLVHQHRPAYDLYCGQYSDFTDDPEDEALRRTIFEEDQKAISEAKVITGISKTVVERLKKYNHIAATPLYPPLPLGGRYTTNRTGPEKYILSVGRLCGIKRVDLMLKALPNVHQFVNLKIVGQPDEPGIMDYLQNEVKKHHLEHRVQFLGRVSDQELIDLYANALCVYYAPHNEDYGYVTLESLASCKPVVAAHDSGGVLEFIKDNENGVVVEPTLDGIAEGCNRLIADEDLRIRLGEMGGRQITEWGLNQESKNAWENVVNTLLQPIL